MDAALLFVGVHEGSLQLTRVNLKRWFQAIRARPAVVRAYEKGKAIATQPTVDEEARKFLFGQSAATVRGHA